MRTEKEIRAQIKKVEKESAAVLNRKLETIQINAPVALMQLQAESHLSALYWTLGQKYQSTLKR